MDDLDKYFQWGSSVGRYQEKHKVPHGTAIRWAEPYDFTEMKDFLKSLPEWDIIELEIGGIMVVEDKYG